MEEIKPGLFGISHSNRDYTKSETWGKNQFNSSFPASLVAYMTSKGLDCVYINTDKDNKIVHNKISGTNFFGISPLGDKTFYAFESVYTPYQKFYKGSIPRIDLVIQNTESEVCTQGIEVKLTALPDNSTCELTDDKFSCELVIRPDTISYLACSIVYVFETKREKLSSILSELENISKWDNEKEIINFFPTMEIVVDKLIKYCYSKQSPLILEPVWKTVGKSPKLADNCLDCFVWSNLSVIHLFTSFSYEKPARIGRTERTLVWLLKMLLEYSKNGQFNADEIIDKLSFNTKNDKAFSVNGQVTYPLLKCIELKSPRIKKTEIKNIILGGGQNLLSPERRFDAIIFNSPELFD